MPKLTLKQIRIKAGEAAEDVRPEDIDLFWLSVLI